MSAPSARHSETGTGLTSPPSTSRRSSRAVDQGASVEQLRHEQAGQRDRSAHRIEDPALPEPDLATAGQIGGDTGKRLVEIGERLVEKKTGGMAKQLLALDQPAGPEADVEEAKDIAARQAAHPAFERIERARSIGGPDECADRRAADDVGDDAGLHQGAQHADMGPAARRTGAERNGEARIAHDRSALPHRLGV
jgi:hypothetical protein